MQDTPTSASDTMQAATTAAVDTAAATRSAAEAGAESAQSDAIKVLNDLQDISFWQIGIVIVGSWLIITLSRRLLPLLAERGPSQFRLYILNTVPIIRLLTLSIAILWVFPIVFNVTLENFLIIAGGASVAIGFAFKDYVSSLIAGIIAIFERPYRPGDWVKIDGDYGEVVSVGMRSLSLVTASDDLITVPHAKIWDQNVSNSNNGERTLMCVSDFYLASKQDHAKIRSLLRDVAMTSGYLQYRKPVLVIVTNEPWGTHYQVKAYPFDLRDQFVFISDITVRGKAALQQHGYEEVIIPAVENQQ
ncbi:mechanosensitive ion channel family protein [Neorhodopirellula pilleata]|uniref:Small-conductance mechanosensitive channel n=1 Tax=Neorhodopirellula pilleata TaxID=2714738 RepID=A0A5C6A2S1_9BACT|nr:mechanosensitive ion channel domain-containing protein [Neorhodopirellula pilleata]TWT93617.1 Small-conductance mechanosensitive channel [Neorhodopirellula pilleata]